VAVDKAEPKELGKGKGSSKGKDKGKGKSYVSWVGSPSSTLIQKIFGFLYLSHSAFLSHASFL
jgi:hypothetical protein